MAVVVGAVSADVRRLAAARFISIAGGNAASVALVFLVLEKTGSALWVTAIMLATVGVQIVALPVVGGLGDRLNRRRVMIGSDLATGLLFLVLATELSAPMLLVVAALAAVAEAPFVPASSAAIASLSGPDGLARANGTMNAAASAGRMVGPLAAGVLYPVVGPSPVFLLNAASFVLSAVLVATVRGRFSEAGERDRGASPTPTKAARHIATSRRVRLMLISSGTAFVTTSFVMIAEAPLADAHNVGATGYGLMIAGWGVGLVAGSMVAARLTPRHGEREVMLAGRLIMGSGILLVPLSPWFAVIPALMIIGGAGSGALIVAMHSQLQRHSPDQMRSRVFALFEAVGAAGFVIGALAAGVLVDLVGPRAAYVVGGAGTLLAAVPLYLNVRR